MHSYCKKSKKHTGNMFPKKLVLISKNKIKGKSKCAIRLTDRTQTKNLSSKIFKTKNGRLIMQSKCTKCGFKKSRFVK